MDNGKRIVMDQNKEKAIYGRETGPDLVRSIACLFVVAVHFYLNCGYYNEPLVGGKMFVMTVARWLFITCVPLFFMLTGYFKLNKSADKSHYKALLSLFVSYVIISVCKMILYNRLYGKIYSFKDMLRNLGNYQIAWYMGMYICLFLMIPFLNKMWHALNEKEQNILLITLIFLCAVYPLFNYIAPIYFIGIYPIMYYFMGVFIRQRRPAVNRWILFAILGIVCVIEAFISVTFTHTGMFDWTVISTADGSYGTLFIAICSCAVFLIFYQVNIKSKIVCSILASISRVSFEIYLFAGMYDAVIYQYLKRSLTSAPQFFWWFFATVPVSFIAAYLTATLFRFVVDKILKLRK